MRLLKDIRDRQIRLTDARLEHIETDHPEMLGQFHRIEDVLLDPDIIVRSRMDPQVEILHKHYSATPVTEKHMCVIVKASEGDPFGITAYFTDTVKGGEALWTRK